MNGVESSEAKEVSNKVSVPVWFWVMSVVALLWYLMDASAFFMRVFMMEEILQTMPEDQQQLYLHMPLWINLVFALEVFGGLFGCISLFFRKQWALVFFLISIFGVLSQTFYVYFLSDAIRVMGTKAVVMPLLAIIIGIGMIVLAKSASSRKWIL